MDFGWITSNEKIKAVSQYRSFVTKIRACVVTLLGGWFQFLSSHNELHRLVKCACLCLPPLIQTALPLAIPIPELRIDENVFSSCVRSVHKSFTTVHNVSSLNQDPKSIYCRRARKTKSRLFRLSS